MRTFDGVVLAGANVARHVAVAQEAEELGYGTGWVTEVAGCDAVSVLAATAVGTTSLRLATGILPIYVRDPYLMAMTLSSLQELSGGRIVAGFGTSTAAIVTGWHGIAFDHPVDRMREYVRLVRALLAGERVKSEGFYNLRGAQVRPPKDPVPVYLAALNTKMLELAGEVADGVILNFPTPGYARRAIEMIGRGLERSGRPREAIRIVANFRTGIGAPSEVQPPMRRELISYFTAPPYRRVFTADGFGGDVERVSSLWDSGDRAGAVAAISSEFVDAHSILGSEAECRAKVQAFRDLGVDETVLFPVVPEGAAPAEAQLATLRAFAPAKSGS